MGKVIFLRKRTSKRLRKIKGRKWSSERVLNTERDGKDMKEIGQSTRDSSAERERGKRERERERERNGEREREREREKANKNQE